MYECIFELGSLESESQCSSTELSYVKSGDNVVDA